MLKKKTNEMDIRDRLCVTREELATLLSCGQATADRVAKEAGAKIYIGKRVLISVEKVQNYLREISE